MNFDNNDNDIYDDDDNKDDVRDQHDIELACRALAWPGVQLGG